MIQSYKPYRTSLISRAQLQDLNKLRPAIMVRDTLLDWATIVLAWATVAAWPTWWVVVLALPIIGSRIYALLIIAHDGLHRRLFANPRRNDLWADIFVLGAIGAINRLNRRNHMRHHTVTCLPDDPDRFKYSHAGKGSTLGFLLFISGLVSLGPALRNIFRPRRDKGLQTAEPARGGGYKARDVVILVAWQAGLIGGLSWWIGWWAYPVLWLLPAYLFGYRTDLTRVFAEHAMRRPDAAADASLRLISYESNWLERQFFAPHNMNHHMPHHLWPGIPYYNLPRADRLIRRSPARSDDLVWRGSYVAYLFAYWRWCRAGKPDLAGAAAASR